MNEERREETAINFGDFKDDHDFFDHRHLYRPDSEIPDRYECPKLPRVLGFSRNALLVGGYAFQVSSLYAKTLINFCKKVGWIVEGQETTNALFWVINAWSAGLLFPSTVKGYWPLVEKLLGKEVKKPSFSAFKAFFIKLCDFSRFSGLDTKAKKAKFGLSGYTTLIKTLVSGHHTYELMDELQGGGNHSALFPGLVTGFTSVCAGSCNASLLLGKQLMKSVHRDNPFLEFYIRDIVDSPEVAESLIKLMNYSQEDQLTKPQRWFARVMSAGYSFQNALLYTNGIVKFEQSLGWMSPQAQYSQWQLYVTMAAVLPALTVGNYTGNHPLIVNYTHNLFQADPHMDRKQRVKRFFMELVGAGKGCGHMTLNLIGLLGALEKFLGTSLSTVDFGLGISNSQGMKIGTGVGGGLLSLCTLYLNIAVNNQPKQRLKLPFIESLSLDSVRHLNEIAGSSRKDDQGIPLLEVDEKKSGDTNPFF